MADWGKLLEQLQGQTKTKLQALDTLQVGAAAPARPAVGQQWCCCATVIMPLVGCCLCCSLQEHVDATPLARDNISSLLDYTPQLLSDNNFKAGHMAYYYCCLRGGKACWLGAEQPAIACACTIQADHLAVLPSDTHAHVCTHHTT